jgi:hypothetical protein
MTRHDPLVDIAPMSSLSYVCLCLLRRHPLWLRFRLHLGRLVDALLHHHHHRTRPSDDAARSVRHLGLPPEFDRFHPFGRVSGHCSVALYMLILHARLLAPFSVQSLPVTSRIGLVEEPLCLLVVSST